jgi:dipeptidyl aminopeptidase/acylaminoacyl peptidase
MGSMGQKPIKAKKANCWIVQRESATEAPNYFITADFDTFTPLTDIQPHRSVNWLTAELITYKKIDGRTGQGVLYKPENFDSSRKYPVIFHYYDRLSQLKNEFLYPAAIIADLNVPWFVSNGYLVVLSDNEYQENGKPKIAECFNSVVSAAKYVSALSYVDPGKLGLQGHSWGGGQTNYLITHSNLFAAAAEFAGGSDNISSYLGLVYHTGIEHIDKMKQGEWTHGKGKSLWENKNDFLLTNHILNADKITSPLLITHNRKDNSIGFWNAVELYMALRRLNKKSWLLEYDNGDHAIYGKDAVDYTIRLTQFFDHYLKGKPAPVWMTRGIPAAKKGVEDGLEPDPGNACGPDCLV